MTNIKVLALLLLSGLRYALIGFSICAVLYGIYGATLGVGLADLVTLEQAVEMEKLTFWDGVVHGTMIGVSFIAHLFTDNIAPYATYNNGFGYNIGYCLGFIALINWNMLGSKD